MSMGKKAYGLNDVPMGLSTSPLYRLGAVEYKYIGIYLGCYKEEGRIRSLRIRASCWSLHPDPQGTLPLCSRVPVCRVVDAESLSWVVT